MNRAKMKSNKNIIPLLLHIIAFQIVIKSTNFEFRQALSRSKKYKM
jgi:hypothetical protein